MDKIRKNKKKRKLLDVGGLLFPTEGIKLVRPTPTIPSSSLIFDVPVTKEELIRRNERKERFASGHGKKSRNGVTLDALNQPLKASRSRIVSADKSPSSHTTSAPPFVGENQKLEKQYLRLTTFPKKEDVRPLEVLIRSLAHIKNRYIAEEDFEWANEQLKSVRQDLTVQNIRNRFVLEVYETHGRILLEHGDLNEFNQCQTMLRSLTTTGSHVRDTCSGDVLADSLNSADDNNNDDDDDLPLQQTDEARDEFRGYAILYALVRNSWIDLKGELSRSKMCHEVPREKLKECACVHAMQVVRAVLDNDYRTFFRLYDSAPHMSAFLMDFLVKRVRDDAYKRIVAAYRPTISVEQLREWLYFDDHNETRQFLAQNKAQFVRDRENASFWIDCKASMANVT